MKIPALIFTVLFLLLAGIAGAQSPVTVTLAAKSPGAAIPADFEGLSFETSALLPDDSGQHVFRPTNQPLINIFKSLGIKSVTPGKNREQPDQIFNSTTLISPEAQLVARYDKIHLVPFVEYVLPARFIGFPHQPTRAVGDFS